MYADFSGFQIDLFIDTLNSADLQVYDSILAERGDHRAVFRIQCNELVARSHVENAIVALAVGPVPDAAARKLPRSIRGALAFPKAVRPNQLARLSIERDNGSARPGGRIQDALDHQRRAFELVFRKRAQVVGLEAPG